jgi:hypothetical protein
VSEGAVSAKRSWVQFGAKPAQSEARVRAAAKRRPPGRGRSGEEDGVAFRLRLLHDEESSPLWVPGRKKEASASEAPTV